jgi:excinuclease ABC subunit C
MSDTLDVREKVRLLPTHPACTSSSTARGRSSTWARPRTCAPRGQLLRQGTPRRQDAPARGKIDLDLRGDPCAHEFEALLLENSLIKEHQPRYNILLRDDKSFPFIRIRNERFPRVEGMRNPEEDGSDYFGPYASVRTMKTVLGLVHNCTSCAPATTTSPEEHRAEGKFKRCLEYHIGNCKGPCEGLQSEEDTTHQHGAGARRS